MSKKKKPHNGILSKKEFKQLKKRLSKGEPIPIHPGDRILIPSGERAVHCRDCKWRNTKGCFCKDPEHVRDNWSCSEGEPVYQ